jgi:hypothetical protein
MKKIVSIAFLTIVLASCSGDDENHTNPAEPTQPKVVAESEKPTEATNSSVSETDSKTVNPETKKPELSATYVMYSLSLQESAQPRSAAKFISADVIAKKATSITALSSSTISAYCGDQVVARSQFQLDSYSESKGHVFRPSLLLPADITCDSAISVFMTINGYEVEIGEVAIGDVAATSQAHKTER